MVKTLRSTRATRVAEARGLPAARLMLGHEENSPITAREVTIGGLPGLIRRPGGRGTADLHAVDGVVVAEAVVSKQQESSAQNALLSRYFAGGPKHLLEMHPNVEGPDLMHFQDRRAPVESTTSIGTLCFTDCALA